MARLPEQRLWDRMRNNLASYGNLRLQRIEDVLGAGLPDVLCLRHSQVTWVELKVAPKRPARRATPLLDVARGLSAEQRNWHLAWTRHGGRSVVVVALDEEACIYWSINGRHADIINNSSVEQLSALANLHMTGSNFWHELCAQGIV